MKGSVPNSFNSASSSRLHPCWMLHHMKNGSFRILLERSKPHEYCISTADVMPLNAAIWLNVSLILHFFEVFSVNCLIYSWYPLISCPWSISFNSFLERVTISDRTNWVLSLIMYSSNFPLCIGWECSQGHRIDGTTSTQLTQGKHGPAFWSPEPSFCWACLRSKMVRELLKC